MNAIFSSGLGFPALWQSDDFAGRPRLPNVEAHLPFRSVIYRLSDYGMHNLRGFLSKWVNCVSYLDDTS
jgi:hypothetical protein